MATITERGNYPIVATGTSTAGLDILNANKGTLASGYEVKSLTLLTMSDCGITINGKYPGSVKAGVAVDLGEKITSLTITEADIVYVLCGEAYGTYTYTT